jgi:hypothetical protein
MEECMLQTLNIYIAENTGAVLAILLAITVFLAILLLAYWFYHRKFYRNLKHQIPATVVQNYLDSIISNSQSLKSSLLLEDEPIPSVVPVEKLKSSDLSNDILGEQVSLKTLEIERLTEEVTMLQNELLAKNNE